MCVCVCVCVRVCVCVCVCVCVQIVAMFPPSAVPAAGASPGAWLGSSRALLAGCDAAVIAIDGIKTLLRYGAPGAGGEGICARAQRNRL